MYFHPTADQIAIDRLTHVVRAHDPDLARGRDRSDAVAAGMTCTVAHLLDTMTAEEIATTAEDRTAWDRLFIGYYGDEPASHYSGLAAVMLPSIVPAAILYRERKAAEADRAARQVPVPASPGRRPRGRHFADVLAARMSA